MIARFPAKVPGGLQRELRDRLHSEFEWTYIDSASYSGSNPLDVLRCQICPEVSAASIRSITELTEIEDFHGRLIWIDSIARGDWSRWSEALLVYADACRNVDVLRRSVFIVVLVGDTITEELPAEVALVCRDYRGVVDVFDLFVYAHWNAPSSIRDGIRRALLAHTVAYVSQWDFFLADQLLSESIEESLYPMSTLCKYARIRGWTAETPRRWGLGTVDGQDGSQVVHSALLAVSGELRQVQQRIWAAQAGVLLPFIEERRVALLPSYRRFLKLPVEIDGCSVSNPLDIEVGQLARLLGQSCAPPIIRKQMRLLRDARNKLAHMEPLASERALHLVNSVRSMNRAEGHYSASRRGRND